MLTDKLIELKRDREIKNINFFNDGTTSKDELGFVRNVSYKNGFAGISSTLENAVESYSMDSDCDFDLIEMNLLLGLIYDKNDVDENGQIIEGSSPKENIVRFYTGSVKSYLEGKQTNRADYYKYGVGRQGFVLYDELLKRVKEENLIFNGPANFEDFKRLVLSKKPFDISVKAVLEREKPMTLEMK